MSELSEKSPSIFRYWVAGIVFLVVGWVALFPIEFFSRGSLAVLSYDHPNNVAIPLVYTLFTIIVTPYIIGRVIKWTSEKIFQRT